jgi:phosphoribosylformimino-5-aminoimidazole carboxamide ribotide isomerase
VDAREGELAVRGWTEASGVQLDQALARFQDAGVAAFVVTDISRDGTLSGPDVAGLAAVLAATEVPVIASGGVGSLADLQALARLRAGGRRLAGAVVGKALYEGAFSMGEAIEAGRGGETP